MEDFTAVLHYRANIKGDMTVCEWPTLNILHDHEKVERIEVSNDEGTLTIHVYTVNVNSVEDAREIVDPIIEKQVDRLASLRAATVSNALFVGWAGSFPQSGGSVCKSFKGHATGTDVLLTERVHVRAYLGPASQEIFQQELETGQLPGEQYFHRFRQALDTDDRVDKFMALYRLLEKLYGTLQRDIDAAIRSLEPGVPEQDSRYKANIKETVYTRLRNEISHDRPDVETDATRAEIDRYTLPLTILVQRALAEQ